jgi:hypothetical protein
VEHGRDAAGRGQPVEVADQPEPGHVGRRGGPRVQRDVGCLGVEAGHGRDRRPVGDAERRLTLASSGAERFSAVVTIPVPIGLVSTSAWPGMAPALVSSRASAVSPMTTWPYSGSWLSIEWPPTTG